MAVSFQCMAKFTTNWKKKNIWYVCVNIYIYTYIFILHIMCIHTQRYTQNIILCYDWITFLVYIHNKNEILPLVTAQMEDFMLVK